MSNTEVTIDIIVRRIEKLWRKANDAGATPAEREAFESKALQLMEEHRISEAMLDVDDADILDDHLYGDMTGRYFTVESDILSNVARAYDCRIWWRNHRGGRKTVYIFGFSKDAERVKLLTEMLLVDARTKAALEHGYSPGETFSIRRSFIAGYAASIGWRLREASDMANKAAQEEHGATAAKGAELVLVSRRKQVHEGFAAKTGLKTQRRSSARLNGGYTRGREAGERASLSTQNSVANRKALAS